MKVGILGPCPPPYGGVTRMIANNVHFWKKEGLNSYLIPMGIPNIPSPPPELKLINYRNHFSFNKKTFRIMRASIRFPSSSSFVFLKYNIALYNIIRKFNLDILYAHHAFHGGLSGILQSKLINIPAVIVSYGHTWLVKDEDRKNENMQRYVLKNADHVISTSEHCIKGAITIGANPSKTDVVYAGIDMVKFHPDIDGTKFRDKYKISEDDVTVSLLGLVLKRKIDTFIDSLIHLKSEKNVKVIIGGIGKDYSYLESVIKKNDLGFVKLAGFIPDEELPQFYAATDIFVVAQNTMVECMGQSMKEAMVCGVPVVGSNIGGVPEAIIDNSTGLLFEPDNGEDLAKKIKILLNDEELRRKLGINARNTALKKFDARNSALRNIEIFKNLINKSA